MKIAIQGEPGSFSHEAAMKLVAGRGDRSLLAFRGGVCGAGRRSGGCGGDSHREQPGRLGAGALRSAADARCEGGAGDAAAHPAQPDRHLRSRRSDEIDRVFSHPVALAQCRRFLAEHPADGGHRLLRHGREREATGGVARPARRGHRQRGGGAVLRRARFCRPASRTTRKTLPAFSWCAAPPRPSTDPEANKISLAFSVENRPGSLVAALNELAAMGTNLTKIESRPVHGKPWEYIFYVDCQIRTR